MKKEQNYLSDKNVVSQLTELIKATDYARGSQNNCLACDSAQWSSEETAGADSMKVREHLAYVIGKMGVTAKEVNGEADEFYASLNYSDRRPLLYDDGVLARCMTPDELCNIVASAMDKKGLLKKI